MVLTLLHTFFVSIIILTVTDVTDRFAGGDVMRSKNTQLKREIYEFVNEFKRENGKSPTLREVAAVMNVSRTTIYRYLTEMNDKGELIYDGSRIDTKEVNYENTRLSSAMIVGSIPCGEATVEEEYVEGYINLPESMFGKGEFYILRAKGDSMEDAGICEKDLVVIRKQDTAEVGDIVVALIDESENTLKRFGGFNKDGQAILEYMNSAVYPGKVILVPSLMVQGVAKHVIKALSKS